MFSNAIALLDQYTLRTGAQAPGSFNPDLVAEVKERLRQLDIVAKVRALEKADEARHRQFAIDLGQRATLPEVPGASPPTMVSAEMASLFDEKQASMVAATFEIRLLTEAFYHFAFRIRQILKHRSKPLPGLSSFECVEGVMLGIT